MASGGGVLVLQALPKGGLSSWDTQRKPASEIWAEEAAPDGLHSD